MLMIPCNRNCQNQKEGYCCLEGITSVTETGMMRFEGCLYFQEKGKTESERQGNVIRPRTENSR